MNDPIVVITDYLLALENLVFVCCLAPSGPRPAAARGLGGRGPDDYRRWCRFFFGTSAAASFLGGANHTVYFQGYCGGDILWALTIAVIGATTFSAWCKGALIFPWPGIRRAIPVLAGAQLAFYLWLVATGVRDFSIVILNYFPALAFLSGAMVLAAVRSKERPACWGAGGALLVFAASGLQQMRFTLHPVYANHNTIYHVLMMLAFWGLYRFDRWFLLSQNDPGEMNR